MSILVLFSGGMDSTVLAEMAIRQSDTSCLFIKWGQPSATQEEASARRWCAENGVDLTVKSIELNPSTMTKGEPGSPCYVPVRNLAFVSLAANVAASNEIDSIWYGAIGDDEEDYIDCTSEWVESANKVLLMEGLNLCAPLISASKADVARMAEGYELDLSLTFSCYQPENGDHCGKCNSCKSRSEALKAVTS